MQDPGADPPGSLHTPPRNGIIGGTEARGTNEHENLQDHRRGAAVSTVICVDVDGTLLVDDDNGVHVNTDLVTFLTAVKRLGIAELVLWSGGGRDYAESAARKTGLKHLFDGYAGKGEVAAGITIDDQDCTLGTVNLKLPGPEGDPWMGLAI